MLDLAAIRAHFPALRRTIAGQPVLYADNPGGTQVPQSVADAMSDYLLHRNANVHGTFLTSHLTDATVDEARAAMADLLNAPAPEELLFGPNMTTLTFHLRHALARTIEPGDEVIVTALDHDANYTPWLTLAEVGAEIRQVGLDPAAATLRLDELEKQLSPRTRLVAFGHASNATGTLSPAAEIVARVRALAPQALIFVDAVQSVPHLPVDVQAIDCDFLACSAYKFFGPHMGILWGRYERLAQLPPYKVRPAAPNPPDKYEMGTKSHEGMAGVTAAVAYLAALVPAQEGEDRRARLRRAMSAIQAHEQVLSRHLLAGIAELPGVTLHGIADPARVAERVPTVAVTLAGISPQEAAIRLGEQGIFCWAGHYYALEVMEALGLMPNGALRLGLAHYNTLGEVDRLLGALAGLTG